MGELLDFKAKVDFTQAKRDIDNFEKMLAKVGVAPAASTSNFTQANVGMTKAIRDSLLETERLRQENLQLQNQWQQGAISLNELTAKQKQNTIARQQSTKEAKEARLIQEQVNGSYFAAQARLKALGVEVKSYENGLKKLTPELKSKVKEYNELNKSLTKFDEGMGNHQRKVGFYSSALKGASGQLAGFVATYVSAAAAMQLISATFTQSLKSSAVRTSLEFTFGSVDLADAKLEQLLDTANRLGVNYNALVSSYKSFTGAVVASNFDFQQGERIFNAVAGAASKLKLSSEDTEGALRALQQMISKGNVQAEELRGQLGERIPGAFSIAARSIGVTETQLNKMLQKGEVLAADLLPALATELEKTFGLETTKKVEGLNAETEKFFNIFSGAVAESTNTNKFFETVLKGFNEIFGTIFKMVNSDSWSEFWTRLTIGSSVADTMKSISKATEQANKAISNTLNIPSGDAKKTTFAYEELSLAYEKATKALTDYKEGVKTGALVDGGKTSIQSLENIVNVTKARMEAVKKLIPEAKATSTEESAAEKAAKLKLERQAEREVNAQRTLQKKITDIQNEASRKTLTKDEEEVQAVKDKFAKITEEVRVFNENPKNKLKVDGSGLAPAMKAQIISIEYKQDTEKLKESLEVQKSLYEQYESYKTELGKKAANERFGAEINTSKKYADILQDEYDKILSFGSAKGFTGAMTERMKFLELGIKAEGVVEQKRQDDLIKSLRSFEQERLSLEDQYKQDRIDVLAKGGSEGLAELDKQHATKLAALGDAHLKEIDAFKELYAGIDRLSDENALKVVSNAEDALSLLKSKGVVISKELESELKQLFGDSKEAIADRLPDRLINLANQIDNVAGAVSGVDENFGKLLSTLGNVVGQVGNIKKDMADLQKFSGKGKNGLEDFSSIGQLASGFAIFSAGASIFSSIFKLFDKSAQREAEAKYARDIQNRQQEASNKLLERQISLIDEAYGTDRILKYDQALKTARESEAKYAADVADNFKTTGDLLTDSFLKQINEGVDPKKISGGDFFKRDAFLDKFYKGQLSKIGDISKLTVQELSALAEGGPIDEGTQKLVENLINAKQAAIDIVNKLNAEYVGQSLDSLADSFISTLTDGVGDFGKTFEETIRKSILNGFKSKFIQDQLQSFYTEFADLSKGGLTKEEIATLKLSYDKATTAGEQRLKDLEAISGVKLTDTGGGNQPETMKGRIESITSNQADKLEGVLRGTQLATIQVRDLLKPIGMTMGEMLEIGRGKLASLIKIEQNTGKTATNTDRLEKIETALVSIDKKMNDNKNALSGNGYV